MRKRPGGHPRVEMTISEVRPRTIDRALALLETALDGQPEGSQPAGVWRTDAGALNQIIAIWIGQDDAEVHRTSSGALSALDEMCVGLRRVDLTPAPFSPALLPRRLGAFYEFRFYTFKPGSFAGIMDRWQGTIGRRLEYSPLLGVWCAEEVSSDELVHAWAYKDANEWQSVRQEVIAKGIWPPPATLESSQLLLRQTSVIALPTSFSRIS
ncbi:NIPSNAP family protein [Bradyrhizobium sp. AUGA SZCCT0042]|uniref:NIPSNAP family protein n=1 Tax=Bradyrhizobium sp. AUGA SZCCT0042 TaxID=2807651 RepID=UPI001BACF861|nr:NIPSNAP family protein [Bradyrhizobium sp. AUGA SZCCT0042]MBR1301085.1 NIPSNAP family protein [Bradyrhizobium sp. AUGA SZCCT0042]